MHPGRDHAHPGGSSGGVSARLAQFNKSTSLEDNSSAGPKPASEKDPAVFFDGSMVGSVAVGRAQQHVRHRRRATHSWHTPAAHLHLRTCATCTHAVLPPLRRALHVHSTLAQPPQLAPPLRTFTTARGGLPRWSSIPLHQRWIRTAELPARCVRASIGHRLRARVWPRTPTLSPTLCELISPR